MASRILEVIVVADGVGAPVDITVIERKALASVL
jgi:hypothetical protein